MTGIGILNEKPYHAALKDWYARPGDRIEVPVNGFIVDIVRNDRLFEIQTANFSSIRTKLAALAQTHPIRLIYPITQEKWIIKNGTMEDTAISRRKSPKRGRVEEMFHELVSIPHLFLTSNFSLEILMTRLEEVRCFEGKRKWRTNGWGVVEHRLLNVMDRKVFESGADLIHLLPEVAGEAFTSGDLSDLKKINRRLAQKMVYCLHKAKAIDMIGKRGRYHLYRVASPYA